jgi:hypothetical protein
MQFKLILILDLGFKASSFIALRHQKERLEHEIAVPYNLFDANLPRD